MEARDPVPEDTTEERLSGQLESRHFYKQHDTVLHRSGLTGRVLRGWSLYATIAWADGREEEVDQFDAAVVVLQRAHPE